MIQEQMIQEQQKTGQWFCEDRLRVPLIRMHHQGCGEGRDARDAAMLIMATAERHTTRAKTHDWNLLEDNLRQRQIVRLRCGRE